MSTTNPYPVCGALGAARLRGALDGEDLREAAHVASALPVSEISHHLADRVAVRPWGVAISADKRRGLAVLAGGLVRAYSGTAWERFKQGAALEGELPEARRGWIATPEGHPGRFGFSPDAQGALAATAVLGVMMHVGVDLPTPLGLGGDIEGPAGASLTGREAWDAFRRTPQVWREAACLFGADRVLDAIVGRRDGTGASAGKVLEALWPKESIVAHDETGTRWGVGDGIVAASSLETWRAGEQGGYATTCWNISLPGSA